MASPPCLDPKQTLNISDASLPRATVAGCCTQDGPRCHRKWYTSFFSPHSPYGYLLVGRSQNAFLRFSISWASAQHWLSWRQKLWSLPSGVFENEDIGPVPRKLRAHLGKRARRRVPTLWNQHRTLRVLKDGYTLVKWRVVFQGGGSVHINMGTDRCSYKVRSSISLKVRSVFEMGRCLGVRGDPQIWAVETKPRFPGRSQGQRRLRDAGAGGLLRGPPGKV